MELTIHVTKDQVFMLINVFARPVKQVHGEVTYEVPQWLAVMWEHAL